MTINPKFKALIPPLSPEEFAQLEKNLIADGCRDLLVTWNGALLDGHNRFDICQRHGVEFKTVEMELDDEDAACVWIIRNQFGRRNLEIYTRTELALKLEVLLKPIIEAKAKERMVSGKKLDPVKNSAQGKSREELAKAAGVSHDTLKKARVIDAKASEEVKAALRAGETTINAEHKKLTVHVGHNSGENEWYTPAQFTTAARAAMGSINLDPASSEIANRTVGADAFFTKEDDGLSREWNGNVWLNPPYASPLISQFANAVADKFDSGEIDQACVLVNNATETAWFRRLAKSASAICFLSSRVKFLDMNSSPSGSPLQGQAVLYFGNSLKSFNQAFFELGFMCHVVQ